MAPGTGSTRKRPATKAANTKAATGTKAAKPKAARATKPKAARLPANVHEVARRRVALEAASPEVDGGRFPAKAVVGDAFRVEVDAFADGHEMVAGVARWRHETEAEWQETPLLAAGNDRWYAELPVTQQGAYSYAFSAWVDHWLTWHRDLGKRVDAGQDVTVDLQIGARFLRAAIARIEAAGSPNGSAADAQQLAAAAELLEAGGEEGTAAALAPELDATMRRHPDREHESAYARELRVVVDRERARFSTWYERFPRSASPEPGRHGTLADVEAELPRIAAMGFDVLYLPPIHPIGTDHRKGPNNAVTAGEGDPGSPWAIGSKDGGHTAIHPELGTLEDFASLVSAATEQGLELALDLAYQCAPDHPWVAEHPTWFRQRPDGTIQYAENPPKKYQDIYPIDFESEDWEALWLGL
ncbi:MAG: glycosidase, partial [Thermoleophilia bacterium]|nr:glycosidase [Thermoleophilia bacterium]